MTKVRPPLSFHQAITRIAGRLTWERCAEIVGKSPRTVANWGDPDTGAMPTLEEALKLDTAYRLDGGGEAPILAVYGLKLDIALEDGADAEELATRTATIAKEAGEAVAAMVLASQPGAGRGARAAARREAEEAIGALQAGLGALGSGDDP